MNVVRNERRPAILHLRTVRLMGHAGSDVELAYRSRSEIEADHAKDPLLATARQWSRPLEVHHGREDRLLLEAARGAHVVQRHPLKHVAARTAARSTSEELVS